MIDPKKSKKENDIEIIENNDGSIQVGDWILEDLDISTEELEDFEIE